MKPQPTPKTQDQRRAGTRAALIDAARRVFAEEGFHATTMAHVASRAGVTTGAIYGRFEGKEDLFLAVFEAQVAEELDAYREAHAGAEDEDLGQAGAARFMARLREDPTYFPLFVEFWSYGVRHADLRPRFAARFAAFREAFADMIQTNARAYGVEVDRVTAERLGSVVNALGNGLALEREADPEAVPDDLLGFTYSVFFEALAARAARGDFDSGTGLGGKAP